jgi:hypothetical protein
MRAVDARHSAPAQTDAETFSTPTCAVGLHRVRPLNSTTQLLMQCQLQSTTIAHDRHDRLCLELHCLHWLHWRHRPVQQMHARAQHLQHHSSAKVDLIEQKKKKKKKNINSFSILFSFFVLL